MVPWLISVVQIQLPRSCPQKLLQAGLQSRCGVYTNSSPPLLSTRTAFWSPAAARPQDPTLLSGCCQHRPRAVSIPQDIKWKVPFVTHPKAGATLPRLFLNFIDQKTVRRKDRSTHCWDSLRRKFQLYRHKDKEWWKLEKKKICLKTGREGNHLLIVMKMQDITFSAHSFIGLVST